MYYLAKVDNAATTGTTGLQWFKVGHEGLSGSQWAVDKMISAGGWHYFTMPTCVAPGDYLLRAELIALHGAQNSGQAQCKSITNHTRSILSLMLVKSIWNALRSALRAAAPVRGAIRSASQVRTKRMTPASWSMSMIMPDHHTWAVERIQFLVQHPSSAELPSNYWWANGAVQFLKWKV